MSDFDIGYKKPPLHTRYKKGDRANPKGRGAKKLRAGKIYDSVFNGWVEMNQGGKKKRIRRPEYMVKSLAMEGAKGKLASADSLLALYHHSKTHGDYEHILVAVAAWEKLEKLEITPGMSAVDAAAIVERLLEES